MTMAGKGPGPSGFLVAIGIWAAVLPDVVGAIGGVGAQPAIVSTTTARPAMRARSIIGAELSTRVGDMMAGDSARQEAPMGAKSDALAKQYEAKVQEATTGLEKLTDAD
jgi:hypothetical protein